MKASAATRGAGAADADLNEKRCYFLAGRDNEIWTARDRKLEAARRRAELRETT
jgi:hypothetical protein